MAFLRSDEGRYNLGALLAEIQLVDSLKLKIQAAKQQLFDNLSV
jgi:hypothetical protein